MNRTLVIGLSGQVGEALLPGLLKRESRVLALSRQARAAQPGVEWIVGSLEAMPELPADVDTILSLGPLDAFAAWFTASDPAVSRVIALSSTGRNDKLHSLDPAERELAQCLGVAEGQLFDSGERRGIAVTVLRPTLLYGSGRDLTISRLLRLGHRWGFLLLPSTATGLRQPVHVADVADAVLRCLDAAQTSGQAYDLPGGEVLAFDAMVRRTLARHAPDCRVMSVPTLFFEVGLRIAALLRRAPIRRGLLARLQTDQLASGSAAQRDFGYLPRRFDP